MERLIPGETKMNDFCPKSSQSNGENRYLHRNTVVNIILGLHCGKNRSRNSRLGAEKRKEATLPRSFRENFTKVTSEGGVKG